MSDLNSPEKPRSEPSLEGSQPHSWSDVTLIEDITQESSSRRLSAQAGGIHPEQLRERSRTAIAHGASRAAYPVADPSTGGLRSQAIQSPKPKSGPSFANRPCLRYNSARPCTRHLGQASPPTIISSSPTQHRPACRSPRSQATDTFLVGELHQEAQNALGPAAGHSASPSGELQAQNATAAEQGRHATKLLRTTTEVVSQHLLGAAVPKPRPLTRPPPRSLIYRPPTRAKPDRVKPLGLFTVKDLPSHQPAPAEGKTRTATKPPAPQARHCGLVSRASQETTGKEACLSAWHEILHILGSASSLHST